MSRHTLHFAEGTHPQGLPQDVVPDLQRARALRHFGLTLFSSLLSDAQCLPDGLAVRLRPEIDWRAGS